MILGDFRRQSGCLIEKIHVLTCKATGRAVDELASRAQPEAFQVPVFHSVPLRVSNACPSTATAPGGWEAHRKGIAFQRKPRVLPSLATSKMKKQKGQNAHT